jgi:hypothetical protein
MVDLYNDSGEIKETDIIFDCPNCQKSLAIDYRGAGLTIPCSDCGNYVAVPIPEGMEVTDIDSTEEEQETRIINLRRSLASAESQISDLSAQVETLTREKDEVTGVTQTVQSQFNQILEQVSQIERGHEDVRRALVNISAIMDGQEYQ